MSMTPNPNPSPELREAAEALLLAMTKRALRGRDHVPSMRDEQTAASALRAVLSPQTLPAPGEVANLRARLVAAEHAALKWEKACQQSWDREALATVAAANDEGLARKWASNDDPVGTLAIRLAATANEAEEEHGEWTWREIADAAIRLLSQGGGKDV